MSTGLIILLIVVVGRSGSLITWRNLVSLAEACTISLSLIRRLNGFPRIGNPILQGITGIIDVNFGIGLSGFQRDGDSQQFGQNHLIEPALKDGRLPTAGCHANFLVRNGSRNDRRGMGGPSQVHGITKAQLGRFGWIFRVADSNLAPILLALRQATSLKKWIAAKAVGSTLRATPPSTAIGVRGTRPRLRRDKTTTQTNRKEENNMAK